MFLNPQRVDVDIKYMEIELLWAENITQNPIIFENCKKFSVAK